MEHSQNTRATERLKTKCREREHLPEDVREKIKKIEAYVMDADGEYMETIYIGACLWQPELKIAVWFTWDEAETGHIYSNTDGDTWRNYNPIWHMMIDAAKKQGKNISEEDAMDLEYEVIELSDQPDPTITEETMNGYGYQKEGMMPICGWMAELIFANKLDAVYILHKDGTETKAASKKSIRTHEENGGFFGIKKK